LIASLFFYIIKKFSAALRKPFNCFGKIRTRGGCSATATVASIVSENMGVSIIGSVPIKPLGPIWKASTGR